MPFLGGQKKTNQKQTSSSTVHRGPCFLLTSGSKKVHSMWTHSPVGQVTGSTSIRVSLFSRQSSQSSVIIKAHSAQSSVLLLLSHTPLHVPLLQILSTPKHKEREAAAAAMDNIEVRRRKKKGRSSGRRQGGRVQAVLRAGLVAMAFALLCLCSSTPSAIALTPDGTSACFISIG